LTVMNDSIKRLKIMFMQSQPTQIEFLEVTRGLRVDSEYDKCKRCLYYANYC
jgi:hypothetical protein